MFIQRNIESTPSGNFKEHENEWTVCVAIVTKMTDCSSRIRNLESFIFIVFNLDFPQELKDLSEMSFIRPWHQASWK